LGFNNNEKGRTFSVAAFESNTTTRYIAEILTAEVEIRKKRLNRGTLSFKIKGGARRVASAESETNAIAGRPTSVYRLMFVYW